MAFTKQQIATAKQGTHWIKMSPYREAVECTVQKVRGTRVYLSDGGSLNDLCSEKLINGDYRHKLYFHS